MLRNKRFGCSHLELFKVTATKMLFELQKSNVVIKHIVKRSNCHLQTNLQFLQDEKHMCDKFRPAISLDTSKDCKEVEIKWRTT